MSKIAALALSVAALSATSATAQTAPFAAYDATQAPALADRLVLCDIADQLASGAPNRDASRSFVREDGSDRLELALPPDFTRPSGWYDYDLERAYYRYRTAGLVRGEDVRAARERYRVPLRGRFDPLSVRDQRFFQAQSRFCKDVVRASWRS